VKGKGIISPPPNTVVYCSEITDKYSELDFYMKLLEFKPLNEEISHYSLLLYAVNAQNQLAWYRFSSDALAIPFQQVQFKGYNTVYLQYTRDKQDASTTFKLEIELKTPEGIQINATLTVS
jgi:hypothetical protein